MNPYAEHAEGLAELQSEMGDNCPVFTPLWADMGDIKILPGGVRTKKDNSPGGFSLDSDLQLTCLLADFGDSPPPENGLFMYNGKKFKIRPLTRAPLEYQVRIEADSVAQKL